MVSRGPRADILAHHAARAPQEPEPVTKKRAHKKRGRTGQACVGVRGPAVRRHGAPAPTNSGPRVQGPTSGPECTQEGLLPRPGIRGARDEPTPSADTLYVPIVVVYTTKAIKCIVDLASARGRHLPKMWL
jgi:hypothetical protein